MKLIRHTISRIALLLIPFALIGGIFIYYTITYISYEEVEEFLAYEMERIIRHHEKFNDITDFNTIAESDPASTTFQPFFKDTLLLETGDMEMMPYRELHFPMVHNDEVLHVVLRHLLPGRDDIAKGSLFIILGITGLLSLMVLLAIGRVTKGIWHPFFRTLDILKTYSVQKPAPGFSKTEIQEFQELNSTLAALLKKMSDDYNRTREFNENAAHELQTQLAVIKSANEELINRLSDDEQAFQEARKVQVSATRLSHMLRSLLLMSKIGNKEFQKRTTINLQEIINSVLDDFYEIIELRNIRLVRSVRECKVTMDKGLALVMITNLIKNAVKYNTDAGMINISTTSQTLMIENSGAPVQQNPSQLLERFNKGIQGNLGLGLSIVKQIGEQYDFEITYSVEEHIHRIFIKFN